jgi:hypothetical protein
MISRELVTAVELKTRLGLALVGILFIISWVWGAWSYAQMMHIVSVCMIALPLLRPIQSLMAYNNGAVRGEILLAFAK